MPQKEKESDTKRKSPKEVWEQKVLPKKPGERIRRGRQTGSVAKESEEKRGVHNIHLDKENRANRQLIEEENKQNNRQKTHADTWTHIHFDLQSQRQKPNMLSCGRWRFLFQPITELETNCTGQWHMGVPIQTPPPELLALLFFVHCVVGVHRCSMMSWVCVVQRVGRSSEVTEG